MAVGIRPFRSTDAPGVIALRRTVRPHQVSTPAGLVHSVRAEPRRAHGRHWTALEGGEVVGYANAGLDIWALNEGLAFAWAMVDPARRGRGIGGRLYDIAAEHLSRFEIRKTYTVTNEGEDDSLRFAFARGFEVTRSSKVWELDPKTVDLSSLPKRRAKKEADGFRLVPLRDFKEKPAEFFTAYRDANRDVPFDEPIDVKYRDWKKEIWDHPDVDFEGSVVITHERMAVSFVLLVVDRDGGRAFHELTGTVREFRRRGLARLAKMVAIEWCVANRIHRVFTDNDSTNADMLAINEHLGYRPLPSQLVLAKES